MEDLPKEIRKLKPYEIEDVLCIYKDIIRGISSRSKVCTK